MYIDALNGKTVTRETLLRYTLKSHSVNDLIRGDLWKTLGGSDFHHSAPFQSTISEEGHFGIALLTCSGGTQHRHAFLPPRLFETGLGDWRGLFRYSRP